MTLRFLLSVVLVSALTACAKRAPVAAAEPGACLPDGQGTDENPAEFAPSFTRPTPLGRDAIQFTEPARAAKASGTMVVRCTITTRGVYTTCEVLQDVPLMRDTVLEALEHHVTVPVTSCGRAIAVKYTNTFRLRAE